MSLKALLQKFLDRLEEQLSSEDEPLGAEFLELRDFSRQLIVTEGYEALVGATEENIRKNRYKDIRPFDNTRVSLCPIPGVPGSDYINANFIEGHHGRAAYIAAQGPMPHTVDDFWAMLWQYKIQVVVMACNEREGSKAKCERYWAYSGEEKTFRGITVKLVKEKMICEDFMIRHLVAGDGTEERSVQQFHYINWPDHGAPESSSTLLDMVAMMRKVQPGDPPPIVVHCSAGCGRTGTICAVDYAWNVLKNGALTKDFSVYNIIKEMRRKRPSSVQSKDQYILVHQAIAELFESHLSMIKDHLYENLMVEGSGRPAIDTEDSIYEDVGGLGKKDEALDYDIYVNADELPQKKRSSSHAADEIIMETVANMVTDEDDETPDKFYSVSTILSKINAGKTKVANSSPEEKVKVRPGPPALPVKKNNLPDTQSGRKSVPTPGSDKHDQVPMKRKLSLSSFKNKNAASYLDSSDRSPVLSLKGHVDKIDVGGKPKWDENLSSKADVRVNQIRLDLGKKMIKGMAGVAGDGVNKSSPQNASEEQKANVNELRHKLEHTGMPVGVMMPMGKNWTVEKSSAQKPELLSLKPEKSAKPFQKPEKPPQKPEKPPQKPEKPSHKPLQKHDNSQLDIVKELLQRKVSGADGVNGTARPEPAPRVSCGHTESDVSSEQLKEEKRCPLPLPRGTKTHVSAKTVEGGAEYSEPYEFVKDVRAQLARANSSTGNVVPVSPSRLPNSVYQLEETVSGVDDRHSVMRQTVNFPAWIDDDGDYSYVGGGSTGYDQELHAPSAETPGDSDSDNISPIGQDLVVTRRTKLLPEWLDDEDPYAVLGGKPQISNSVGYDQELHAPSAETPGDSDSDNISPIGQDLVVTRRTKLLPEWLDDEDPYAVLGGKPQISNSVGVQKEEAGKAETDLCVYAVLTPRQHRKQLIANAVDMLASSLSDDTFPFQENCPDDPDPSALSSPETDTGPREPLAKAYSNVDYPLIPSFSPLIQPDEYTFVDSGSESELESEHKSFSSTSTVDNDYEEVIFEDGHFILGKADEDSLPDLPKKGQTLTLNIPRRPSDPVPPALPPRSPIDAAPPIVEQKSVSEPQSPDHESIKTSLFQSLVTLPRNTSDPFLVSPKRTTSPPKQLSTFFLPSLVQGSKLPTMPTDECSSPQVPHKPPPIQPPNGAFATWHAQEDTKDDRPPVPTKSFDDDRPAVPAKLLPPELPDLGRSNNEPGVKDTRPKFKLKFSTFKNKFQTGKGSDLSLDNISLKDDSRFVPIPYLLGFPNRIDKRPKGGRPPPWSSEC